MKSAHIYNDLLAYIEKGKLLALLIDPDKTNIHQTPVISKMATEAGIDLILVGGSLVSDTTDSHINEIKNNCDIPVILFPGSLLQLSINADAVLLLSMISGRNPELLIGNHVIAAPYLKKNSIETISTGYMLIESSNNTSVQYISGTRPIPADKPDIAVATAIAGEMLGLKMIYLEAGSGANPPVPLKMIQEVRKNIGIPLIVGGGIKTVNQLIDIYSSGADIAVIGSAIENNPNKLLEFSKVRHTFQN